MGTVCPSATPAQYMVFFFGLYLIALGTGGIKPCVSSFDADQFDDTDPKEREGLAKIKEVLEAVMNIYMKTMTEDDDKEVVAQACMSVVDIIKEYGYVAIEQYVPRLVDATLVLLREESCCQQEESDGDIDDDDTKHDEELMDAVFDLLPAFAKSMGSHFAPIFAKLFDPLMKFARASRPLQDRTMVVACLVEVAQDMGPPIAGYVDVP